MSLRYNPLSLRRYARRCKVASRRLNESVRPIPPVDVSHLAPLAPENRHVSGVVVCFEMLSSLNAALYNSAQTLVSSVDKSVSSLSKIADAAQEMDQKP